MISRVALTSLVAALSLLVFAATASAVVLTPTNSPLPGSTFQGGDGNQDDPGADVSTPPDGLVDRDWQSVAGSVTTATDDNALDSMFEGGDKETEPYHWFFEQKVDGVTPSKSNLFSAWTHTDPTSSDVFLNLAFQREASTGNTFATFELNQRTDSWINDRGTAIPCRTTGDILISYNVASGGSPPNVDVVVYSWTSTATNPQGCGRTGTFQEIDPQPFAQGAVNGADIANYLPGAVLNSDGKIEEGTWGEATINLTGLFQQSFENPCFSFGQIQMHTRSSTSIDSQLQDFISPVPVLVRSCAINVEKTGPATVHHGDQMTFDFDVTNAGNVPLGNIAVDDDQCPDGNVTGPVKSGGDQDDLLEGDEHWVYTCTMPVPAHSSGEADPHVNTVTATGTAGSNPVSDTDTHSVDILHPDIEIDKKVRRVATDPFVDGPISAKRGDTLEYQFTVTNPGDAELTVVFDDPRCDVEPTAPDSGDSDGDNLLDVGETWVYTCSHLVTGSDDDPFENRACVVGTDSLGGSDQDCDETRTDILNPEIDIEKQLRRGSTGAFVDGPIDVHRGDTIEYEFVVTNPGDVELTVVFDDPRCDSGTISGPTGDSDADGKLDTDETWTYHCSHLVTAGDPDPLPNTATATGTDPLGQEVDDEDSAQAAILEPGIELDKKVSLSAAGPFVDGPVEAKRGDTLYYEFTVTNTGDTQLSVSFSDPRCDSGTISGPAGDSDGDDRLDLSETWIYTCSRVVTASDDDPFENRACVVGTDTIGGTVEDCDNTVTNLNDPAIHVEKTVRVGGGAFGESVKAHVGETLEYRFVVTNTGDVPLEVTLSDPKCDAGTLTFNGGDDDSDGKLDTTETWVYGCTHVLTAADLAAGANFPNVATAEGQDSLGQTVTDDDDANATILDPRIRIDKLVRVGDSGTFVDSTTVEVGQTLTYQLTVTNAGNTPLAVNVSDPRCDSSPEFQGGDVDGDNLLDVGETWVYTCTHVVTASDPDPLVNTATAEGTDEIGGRASDDDTANADILPPVSGALPEVARSPGAARLAGKTGCVSRPFLARVSGRSIAKVVFRIDGRTVKTLTRPNSGSRFTYRVDPRKFKNGAHRLEATVSFTRASGTRAKRLRVTFLRCARKAAPPRFTG